VQPASRVEASQQPAQIAFVAAAVAAAVAYVGTHGRIKKGRLGHACDGVHPK